MRIERPEYSPSGNFPLPLAIKRASELEGEKILRVWEIFNWLIRHRFPTKLAPLALPVICVLSGIHLGDIEGTKKLILGLNEMKSEEIPSPSDSGRERFLEEAEKLRGD